MSSLQNSKPSVPSRRTRIADSWPSAAIVCPKGWLAAAS
jgi:hypothetical protein